MLYCEPCRKKNNWLHPATWPYSDLQIGRCKECGVQSAMLMEEAESVLRGNKTNLQKTIDKTTEMEYKRKAEGLTITHVWGSFAGREDGKLTGLLHQIFIHRGNEVDWKATYELRLKAQQGHYSAEEKKRDRRG